MDNELKPCAHCGGNASVFQAYDGFYAVQCNVCGMTTLHVRDMDSAIATWNRRVSTDGTK